MEQQQVLKLSFWRLESSLSHQTREEWSADVLGMAVSRGREPLEVKLVRVQVPSSAPKFNI